MEGGTIDADRDTGTRANEDADKNPAAQPGAAAVAGELYRPDPHLPAAAAGDDLT